MSGLAEETYLPEAALFGGTKAGGHGPLDWQTVSIDQFIAVVDSYIRWYNEKRIKISLGARSPIEYRASLGLTT
ncbi:IS3 family transposase [Burkholderia multivorans]|nr:IS3 family transposase [Burkholderia multivorans]MBU9345465.1 IS3 family transposase [Burkholderia multivorans]